jgi:16S rRNA (cytosine967-C5)-methyltransferase
VPEGLVLGAPFDAHGSELFQAGAIMPQSRGSMLVARVLAPRAGDRVLDLCAAPGAKTTHLAALMGDRGQLVAVERHPGRAGALERTCRRMHASCAQVEVADATELRLDRSFDRVLVDPPCSGLGTLQSRPDLRWRVDPASLADLVALQDRILSVAGAATAPGGVLVYSLCTISRREGEEVLRRFLRTHPDFSVEDPGPEYELLRHPRDARWLQLLPHRDGTDGFFIARLRRG